MQGELLPRVKELFGPPEIASLQQALNAQDAERQRRADALWPANRTETSHGGTTTCRPKSYGFSRRP